MAAYEDTRSYLASALPITISDDFWAGWISGVLGVMAGNPLDRRKVQLQSGSQSRPAKPNPIGPSKSRHSLIPPSVHSHGTASPLSSLITKYFPAKSPLAGAAAPSLGVGVLNALLYMIYNRTEEALNHSFRSGASCQPPSAASANSVYSTTGSNLWTTWLAGAAGGLATSVVNTPLELIKCRAQLASLATTYHPYTSTQSTALGSKPPLSSWHIAKTIWQTEGTRGLFHGGVVTAWRDGIGYGFYFWAYELGDRVMSSLLTRSSGGGVTLRLCDTQSNQSNAVASTNLPLVQVAVKDILCGGVAGVVTWASIFPLDVVKTRLQVQGGTIGASALGSTAPVLRRGAMRITKELYMAEGSRAFFRGLAVCSVRAFFVNAVQWPAYKWTMAWLSQKGQGRED
ncbi:mitochondrial carrier [Xylaria arbuscula]|nr:mitochondrial carrier [Xylaria arbuscula]